MANMFFVILLAMLAAANACDYSGVAGQNLADCPLTVIDGNAGVVELHLVPFELKLPNGRSFMVRAYSTSTTGPSVPGPVIRIKQNKHFLIDLYNQLGNQQTAWDMKTMAHNGYFEANTTNLHLHGIHCSSEEPSDDVAVRVPPGFLYHYAHDIGAHGAGVFMYHAHSHGSVTLQTGGGAFGMLIVDDDETNSPFTFLQQLPEVLLSLFQFSPLTLQTTYTPTDPELFRQVSPATPKMSAAFLVNGLSAPVLSMNPGQWYRWRLMHNSVDQLFSGTLDGCQMTLLALDGVYLNTPRVVTKVYLEQPSRADVAVMCPTAGTYTFIDTLSQLNVFTVKVEATAMTGPAALNLGLWAIPARPDYLVDTLAPTTPIANTFFSINMTAHPDSGINGAKFAGFDESLALHRVKPNTIEEWTFDITTHPLHLHISPFQLQENSADGNYLAGDWLDTYIGSPVRVRSHIGNFAGKLVLHCHISPHSDLGIMGHMWIDAPLTAVPQKPTAIPGYKGSGSNAAPYTVFIIVITSLVALIVLN